MKNSKENLGTIAVSRKNRNAEFADAGEAGDTA
jgi:hypothetical protein